MSGCNPETHVATCDGQIDGDIILPTGYEAVPTVVNGQVVWQTSPQLPPEETINFLVQQTCGKILIDDGIFLVL